MRVLLNGLQGGNRSGTGRHTHEIARRVAGVHDDLEVHVAWPDAVPFGAAPDGDGFLHTISAAHPAARLWFDQKGIHALAKRIGADLVHYPANVGAILGRTQSIVTVHDLSFFKQSDWFRWERALYYRAAVRWTVRRAARVITVSEAAAADLHEVLGVPRERISVVPNGCGPEFGPASNTGDEALRDRLGLPPRFLLFVGTLEPRKNLPRLIEAFDRVAGGIPHDLVLAGREGWKVEAIHAALGKARNRARIHLPGFVSNEELPALMRLADGFAFPSLYEGFGLPPLEAMASGTPALVADSGSLPEVTGEAALLVDPWAVDSIAEGLRQLATEDALRDALRRKGLERAAAFTWERAAALTREAYAAALK